MKTNALNLFAVLTASFLLLCSCQERLLLSRPGDAVRFTAGSGFAQTKASYSGVTNSAGTIERIDWQAGDLMRIYCAQASEPDVHYADYRVKSVDTPTSGSAVSTAHIETFSDATDGIGLRWGEGGHTFYAAFPSPATTGGITTSISVNKVKANLSDSQVPASVTNSGVNYTAVADLKNMLMTAKAGPYTAETMPDESTVFLAFTPLTTTVKFTITNQSKAALTIKSVSLISDSSALNGPFSVDIDDVSHQPESVNLGSTTVTYSQTYPYCQYTGTVSDATKKVTINFATPITLAYDANIANCGSLTFTFFLQPSQNFDDLTFKLVKSDDSWMSTKLGYTDGTGILFPRFKKTAVNGVFVPEGAQWTVKYDPTVQSWNQSSSDINPMPEVNEDITLVTSWDAGVNEPLELKEPDYLPGIFTISAGADEIAGTDDDVKVRFSKGNLIATVDATGTPTNWRFATNQYDCLGEGGANQTIGTTAGDVDIFWWSVPDTNYGINGRSYDNPFIDWGNTMDNKGTWCTLSTTEWRYLFSFSVQANDIRAGLYSYGVTVVGHTNCCILYPDGYSGTKVSNGDTTSYDTAEEWSVAEKEGVVCLPAGGIRRGSIVSQMGTEGYYWSSSYAGVESAYDIYFSSERIQAAWYGDYLPSTCCSVRLVTDAN